MPKVTCCSLNTETGPHLDIFTKAGFEVAMPAPGMDLFNPDHLIAVLQDSDAVVAGSEPYTRKVIAALPKLRVISRRGVGFDAVDLQAADDHDIVVTTTPGVLDESVAEHALAMIMAIGRGYPQIDRQVREGKWLRIALPRVSGKTVGIIGLGRIGQALVPKAQGIGMKVIAYDPFPNADFLAKNPIEIVPLDELYARSDYVSLHLNCSPEMVNMINRESLAKMKQGSYLVNTGRGQLVQEDDLYQALKSGHLAGAALDVFQVEPLPLTSPLLELHNVLVSGHLAGLDQESNYDIAVRFSETIVQLYRGEWPTPCIRNLVGKSDWKWAK